MNTIRTVIWDCDQVMWFYKVDEVEILAKILQIPYSKELEEEYFDLISEFMKYFSKRRVTRDEYYKIIEREMPLLYFYNISPKQFSTIWDENRSKLSVVNKDVFGIMKYLNEKGIKNVVKTDWWKNTQIKTMKDHGVFDYVEEVYGCDNGYLKTHPLAAAEFIKPGSEEEYLMIGDSLKCDISFANRAGIASVWFNPKRYENMTIFTPDFEISSLKEISRIL